MTSAIGDESETGQQQQQTKDQEVKVFVSGCYDILHGGHLEFWSQARALGTHLTVSFASDDVLAAHKSNRRSSIPTEHKKQLIGVWVCASALQQNCGTYPCPRHVQPWSVPTPIAS